jgi:hypothetical protein
MREFSTKKAAKYLIKEKLNRLPKEESLISGRTLYKELGISRSTWFNYLNAKPDDKYDIPLINAIRLARYFGCSVEDLVNIQIQPITLEELKRHDRKTHSSGTGPDR